MKFYGLILLVLLSGCSTVTQVKNKPKSYPVEGSVEQLRLHEPQSSELIADASAQDDQAVEQITEESQKLVIVRKPKLPGYALNELSHDQIARWLQEAEKSLQHNRLTTPTGSSAFDFYKKVLQRQSNNVEALAGLEAIVSQYIVFINTSLANNNVKDAKRYINRANNVVPNHPTINELQSRVAQIEANTSLALEKSAPTAKVVKKEQTTSVSQLVPEPVAKPTRTTKPTKKSTAIQTVAQSVMKAPSGYQKQRVLLPPEALKNRNKGLVSYLRKLAKQIAKVDGRLIISASKDNDIRWIYKVLNDTDEEYRIRANIEHKSPVSIQITYAGKQPVLDVFE